MSARIQSPRFKRKKRKIFLKKFFLFFLLFLLILAGLYFGSRIPSLLIKNVEVNGNSAVKKESILELAEAKLAGRHFFLFPRNNIFLYPQREIEEEILSGLKRISKIEIDRRGFDSINIEVAERENKYIWCGGLNAGSECYFADEEGFIFAEAPYFSEGVFFTFYGDKNVSRVIGERVFGPGEIEKINSFRDSLEILGIKTWAFFVGEGGYYEFLLKSNQDDLESAPRIIFNQKNNFEEILGNLNSALEAEPFAPDFREKISELEYIDLRFEKKVLYKFK